MPKNPPVKHLQNTGHSWLEGAQPAPQYEVQEYPKTMHHKSGKTAVVQTPDEEKKLGGDWEQTPAKFAEQRAKDAEAAEAARITTAKAAIDKEAAEKKAAIDKEAADKAARDKAAADKAAADHAAAEKAKADAQKADADARAAAEKAKAAAEANNKK